MLSIRPELESLVLHKSLPNIGFLDWDTFSPLSRHALLPKLEHLDVMGSSDDIFNGREVLYFASCLQIPSLRRLHVCHAFRAALRIDELIPKHVNVDFGASNALKIRIFETGGSCILENLQVEFGHVHDIRSQGTQRGCRLPSDHFAPVSSFVYTIDHVSEYLHCTVYLCQVIVLVVHMLLGGKCELVEHLVLSLENYEYGRSSGPGCRVENCLTIFFDSKYSKCVAIKM